MKKAINKHHHPSYLILILSLLSLAACSGSGVSLFSTIIDPTVTPNLASSLSQTPLIAQFDKTTDVLPTATEVRSNTLTLPPPDIASLTPTFQPVDLVSSTPTLKSTANADSATTPTPISTGTAQAFVPSKYTMSVMLDYTGHTLSNDETIHYFNSTGETLNSLVLAVEPNLWKDCFIPGSMTVNGQAISNFTLDGDRLEIQLPVPLAPQGTFDLFIHYDLHLPAADVYHVFGYNDYQTNLVDWYPFIVPFVSGQGWLLHPPANVGEHLVYDVENVDLTLHLTDLNLHAVIAASGPAETITFGWRYRMSSVRSFAFSISSGFKIASTKVNGVTVKSYFFAGESAQGQTVLTEVAKAVATYEALFGPDPYTSLSIVESPFYDGMEYDGLFFLSRDYYMAENGTVLNNLIDIAVHETAHQWWFGLVGNDQALEPWLDEALSTFSERLFYEKNYPMVNAWQSFRIDAYNPTGWVDTDIYHGVDFRTYANAVYLRGAQFLQALRERVGDDVFFAFLKDYASQMAGNRATSDDFFRILRQHTSMDISDLISGFFQNPH